MKKRKFQNHVMHLQVKNDGLLTTQDGRGVREQGIKDSEITCVNLNPMHDCILVHVEQWTLTCGIKQNPTSRRLCLLLHNRQGLRVRRDNAPFPSHPFTQSHLFKSHAPNLASIQNSNSTPKKLDSVQRPPKNTEGAKFPAPLSRISSNTNWVSKSRLKKRFFQHDAEESDSYSYKWNKTNKAVKKGFLLFHFFFPLSLALSRRTNKDTILELIYVALFSQREFVSFFFMDNENWEVKALEKRHETRVKRRRRRRLTILVL